MNANDIRRRFLDYFGSRGHDIVASSPLVPRNDPTLLFVNAGMVQFKDVFTGAETRDVPRATTVQRCLRVSGKHNDLENVGRTPRHHTFFEMLGNFSFGDYFKEQAIPMAWELLTSDLGVDGDRLWVTVFEEDDEAFEIWRDQVGVPTARIQRLGAKDNFWAMGDTGPCGPCSEIHYDHGPAISDCDKGPAFDDMRFVEIWNLVFMQFEQRADGTRAPLPRPSIDTGAGLERVAAALQGVYSNYDTDLFRSLIDRTATVTGRAYGATDDEADVAMRVIADHARATANLIADGVVPSNTERGYVLRRVMRRAIRFGVKIGMDNPFFHHVTDQVVNDLGEVYPNLAERRDFIDNIVRKEELGFRRTLRKGLELLDGELATTPRGGHLSGDVAFKLSDTYGFPVDLTRQIAEENGVSVDEAGFDALREEARARSRADWKGGAAADAASQWAALANELGETEFTGYELEEGHGTILAVFRTDGDDTERVDALQAGQRGILVLDQTPFYGESGGQVGDIGVIEQLASRFEVGDTAIVHGVRLHQGVLAAGSLREGDPVVARVDTARRNATRRNHTATHLLHAALREALGEHVAQQGSLVAPDRLRFDFLHPEAVDSTQLEAIERRVNEQVLRNAGVATHVEDYDAAIARGAMALFSEKYADRVRVVSVPGFSVELCGGTHVQRTGDIGLFRITSEGSVSSGVRRIEAQTGLGSLQVAREEHDALQQAAAELRTEPARVVEAIQRLQEERKALQKELAEARKDLARGEAASILQQARDIGGVKVLCARVEGDLREQADRLRDQLGTALVVLASDADGRVKLLAAATRDIAGSRVHAGNVIREIAPLVGGGGGGRPDMAQAGGKDPSGIDAALARAWELAEQTLGG